DNDLTRWRDGDPARPCFLNPPPVVGARDGDRHKLWHARPKTIDRTNSDPIGRVFERQRRSQVSERGQPNHHTNERRNSRRNVREEGASRLLAYLRSRNWFVRFVVRLVHTTDPAAARLRRW